MRRASQHLILLLSVALASCSQLPQSGPTQRAIYRQATTTLESERDAVALDYALVDIDRNVLENVRAVGPASFYASFGGGRGPAPEIRVGVGDVIQVSVFSSPGGLFAPSGDVGARPGSFLTLPPHTVDKRGDISVPYAGEIHAAGRSLREIQRDIEARLAQRAIEPQVIVSLVEQNAAEVAVIGDASGGYRSKIKASGERILDVIARAGSIRYPGYEVFVTLQRGKRRETVFFPTLVNSPAENIYVAPGDIIYVHREQQRFVAVGALGSTGQTQGLTGYFTFDAASLSLAEAIGKAGGLLDSRADPGHVYLYRLENREALAAMGVNLSGFSTTEKLIPTIYRANLRDPSSFFFTQQFPMRHKDIIYIANAEAVEVEKFLVYVRLFTGTASAVSTDVLTTRNNIRALGH
jgi:polysaccharide export outer membrane protein